jgi:hypothetical protein
MAGGSFESWIKRADFYLKKKPEQYYFDKSFYKKAKGLKAESTE